MPNHQTTATSNHRSAQAQVGIAPCLPTGSALAASRPLGLTQVQLTDGFWADRQRVNAQASLPLARERLEAAGNLHDLRLAAGLVTAEPDAPDHGFIGPLFADSDVYKSLEAAAWEAGRVGAAQATDSTEAAGRDTLTGWIDELARLLEAAQVDDGYLNSYVQVVTHERYARLAHSHEMYCAGHLFQAAVAAARATGDERLLAVASRFADHLVATFGPADKPGLDGHPEVETALVELYRQTGHAAYLKLAEHFVAARGHRSINGGVDSSYFTDASPADTADSLLGHAVRALYFDAGVVDVAVETGDRDLLAAVERRWEDMVATKTAITGGVGSRHSRESFGDRFELPPDRSYNESCAAIASVMLSWRLLLATGRARYADLIERTLLNSLAASVSIDGAKFFYVNPLQRRADHAEGDDPGRRHEWFSCACCPPNIMRILAALGGYVASARDNDQAGGADRLFLHQFVSARIDAGQWAADIAAELPVGGHVQVRLRSAPAGAAELAVRVPSWSPDVAVRVNGTTTAAEHDDGYLVLARSWTAGDVVDLEFDLRPRLVAADPRVDALRGAVAVVTGPVVHCLEAVDQPAGTDLSRVRIGPDTQLVMRIVDVDGVGRVPAVEVDGFVEAVPASTIRDGAADVWPYRAVETRSEPPSRERVRLRTIPYFAWDNRDGGAMRVWIPVA